MLDRASKKEIVSILAMATLFIVSAYTSQMYSDQITGLLGTRGNFGMPLYVFLAILSTVVAPISAAPLIPVAAMLWGPVTAAVLSIVGWSIGSFIAFYLARRYGYVFLQKFMQTKKIQKYLSKLSPSHLFGSVLILRTALPVDVLSYVLGLFTAMPFLHYAVATVIGIAPFAFIFAYISMMPIYLQLSSIGIVVLILFFEYRHISRIVETSEE